MVGKMNDHYLSNFYEVLLNIWTYTQTEYSLKANYQHSFCITMSCSTFSALKLS